MGSGGVPRSIKALSRRLDTRAAASSSVAQTAATLCPSRRVLRRHRARPGLLPLTSQYADTMLEVFDQARSYEKLF